MIVVITFTSIELALYFLILSTLLSPELTFGGASAQEVAAGMSSTTESRGITLRLDDIMLTLISFTWLVRMAVRNELGFLRRTPINQAAFLYWVACAFSTMIAFFSGKVGLYGIFFVIKYLEYFILFYIVVNHVHDEAIIKRFLMVMIFTCLVASLIGIAQIPSGLRVSAPFEGAEGEPNTFGGYLMFMFSIMLGILLHTTNKKQRFLLFIAMGIILIPFAFTESRSSYLSFIVAIICFLFYSQKKKLLFFMCLTGLALAPFVLPQNVINRVMFTFNQAEQSGQLQVGNIKVDTSTTERLRAWEDVITNDFPKNPVFGVGVTGGKFLDAQYPRVLLETGIVGLVLFIWFLRRVWVLLKKSSRKLQDPVMRGVALGALCGFAGLLVHGIGANTFIIVRIMEPFMIILGLVLAMQILEKEKKQREEDTTSEKNNEPIKASVRF
ncbi:O-antigen ligase family protein [Ghiorsea bivora]|uniref:O-antigen ligase family protein n=1 Tax=Ghiorsea bivora TaxID=1485545 RepID=UPI0009DCA907|nr:O-antigen ligase family protein [Ghiorsea bivora]